MNEQEDEGTGTVEVTEPSAAAMAFVFECTQPSQRYVIPQISDSGTLYAVVPCGDKSAEFYVPYLAHLLDRFAQQAVEARVVRIVAALEQKLGVVQSNAPIVKELYPGEVGSWENALKFAIALAREEG